MMNQRVRLGVNIDHVATLRQARRGIFPDPVEAALAAERAGAASIVCHLREDRRHIQEEDVRRLRRALRTRLNLEMAAAPGVVEAALTILPDQVTLVPERRQELTTEGGLDAAGQADQLAPVVRRFKDAGIAVSLFIDPDPAQLEAARQLGVSVVELHTGRYADALTRAQRLIELEKLRAAARSGAGMKLGIAAGHGLDCANVGPVAAIAEVEELNIGYSIIGRSIFTGLDRAVKEMLRAMQARGVSA